jgi:hypothetical protein
VCNVELESCSTFKETVIKAARKNHTCDCCSGPINKGEKYLKHFSVFDGHVSLEKQCSPCTNMVQEFYRVHGQYSNPSYMPQLLRECIAEDDALADKWRGELRLLYQRAGQVYEEDEADE